MKPLRIFLCGVLVTYMGMHTASAEDLKTFCSQTCGLWPKLCASATVCVRLCRTPHRLMKACGNNKIPVDTKLPEISYSKQQFCQQICSHDVLRCSVATYCIQTCKTPSEIVSRCAVEGHALDTTRPQLQG